MTAANTTPVFIAVGSNIDAERNIARALAELRQQFGPLQVSSAYRNAAFGFEGPDFINLVVGFATDLALPDVIARLHAIETLCGRVRAAPKWASRAMDLDVLLYGDAVRDEPGLKLPRPCLLKRVYMLGPMAEIAGHVRHPVERKTIAELWAAFDRDAYPMTKVAL